MSDFVPNAAGMADFLNSSQVGTYLQNVVDAAAAEARRIAPVGGPDDDNPGEFRDSIEGIVTTGSAGQRIGRLQSTDPTAPHKEFGTEDTPAFHTLRRAVEQLGLHIERSA